MQENIADEVDSWMRRLQAARDGASHDLGRLLDELRSYLTIVAQSELDSDLRVKESASDLVQRSLLEATRDFSTFRGGSRGELREWLKQILLNNVRDVLSRYLTAKRQINREKTGSANGAEVQITSDDDSPSEALLRKNRELALNAALDKLSAEQREIIHLHHRENKPFAEVGTILGITEMAAQKRWVRAIEELRNLMK